MATKMVMPLLGQTMEEGTIIKWFKSEGDSVQAGEPLLEVMTDKVNMEVEAPESGILRKIIAKQDDIVPVKDPICVIGNADESIDDLLKEESGPAPATSESDQALVVSQTAAVQSEPAAARIVEAAEGRVFASPSAKRVAAEKGIDIDQLAGRGSGPGGRIVEKDVLDFAASGKATPLAEKMAAGMGVEISAGMGTGIGGRVTSEDIKRATTEIPAVAPAVKYAIGARIPYTGMRKAVGQNVAMSAQTSPHVTLVAEVDMTECVALRKQVLSKIEEIYGVRISFTDIITKAVARAIIDKPIVNSSLEGEEIVMHDGINIGIATAIESGLVVPVIKDVPAKTLPQVSAEIKEIVAKARTGKAGGEDFRGGTFSITNLGAYGIQSFNPIITPGQSAILGVCAITEKPVVIDGKVEVRSMMNLCLSFDHRVMDGAPAAEYLAQLKSILESPYLIFM